MGESGEVGEETNEVPGEEAEESTSGEDHRDMAEGGEEAGEGAEEAPIDEPAQQEEPQEELTMAQVNLRFLYSKDLALPFYRRKHMRG